MIHERLYHAFQTIATFHRVKNCLLYEHLSHSDFEDVLCSSVWNTGYSRDAYTFERGRVVNHADTLGLVVLLLSSVCKGLELVPAKKGLVCFNSSPSCRNALHEICVCHVQSHVHISVYLSLPLHTRRTTPPNLHLRVNTWPPPGVSAQVNMYC